MKKVTYVLAVLFIVVSAWAASSTSSTRTDCTSEFGACDPRIYGGAADTMKQSSGSLNTDDGLQYDYTLTITAGYVEIDCDDSGTCKVTMTETGAYENDRVTIVNVGTYDLNIADQTGIVNCADGSMDMGPEDTMTMVYTGTIWVETSRSDN